MRILIIDDDLDIREVLSIILGAQGHQIDTAADGLGALALLRSRGTRPDLIVLDLMMPNLDGEGFLRQVRQDPILRGIPVIVVSGDPQASQRVRDLAVDGYLVKPFELDQLLAAVSHIVPAPTLAPVR